MLLEFTLIKILGFKNHAAPRGNRHEEISEIYRT